MNNAPPPAPPPVRPVMHLLMPGHDGGTASPNGLFPTFCESWAQGKYVIKKAGHPDVTCPDCQAYNVEKILSR